MKCVFTCTASAYRMKPLCEELGKTSPVRKEKDYLSVDMRSGPVFIFEYGCAVMWGLTSEDENSLLRVIKPFEEISLRTPHRDDISFTTGEKFTIEGDELVLENRSHQALLAASYALSQSVKLDAYEESVDHTVESTQYLPEQMAKMGKIGLSRREIRKKMGELFIERNSINFHSDILDKPEFFWGFPELEPLYTMIANYLDLGPRVDVLNQRLGVIHELFDMLNSELNHQQTSRLEWIIIILIFIEVGIALLKDVFRII